MFKQNICTTREQSERLINLGLDVKTSDFFIDRAKNGKDYYYVMQEYHFVDPIQKDPKLEFAWSLSRLIEMLPSELPDGVIREARKFHPELIKVKDGYVLSIRKYEANCLVGTHIENDPIECCVSVIEWLIEHSKFDKTYLDNGHTKGKSSL